MKYHLITYGCHTASIVCPAASGDPATRLLDVARTLSVTAEMILRRQSVAVERMRTNPAKG